jgi:hypothetical protein
MPVYALYVPTARRSVSGIEMERFPSREQTARILKERNNTKRSRTYYVIERERPSDQERGYFQNADRTGYMRVFLRYAKDPVPGLLDRPDEEWILERGGKAGVVVRLPWLDGDEKLTGRGETLRVDPARLVPGIEAAPDYEVRQPTTVKPEAKMCDGCYMIPSVTGRCGCS